MRVPLWSSVLILMLAVAGCGEKKVKVAPVDPAVAAMQVKVGFTPKAGMTRAEVESALGEPSFVGQTKEGNPLCMYTIEGEEAPAPRIVDEDTDQVYGKGFSIRRTVIYDAQGRVAEWYGFERRMRAEPAEPAAQPDAKQ